MNRREWLKSMSALAVGAIAGPSLLAVFEAHAASQKPATGPRFFSPPQNDVIASVADIVIPRTDTPGAIDIGAPCSSTRCSRMSTRRPSNSVTSAP